jgi:sec-independent protein translocase protein TatB
LPVGFSELVVLFVIGLLILGPERLPRVATQIGRWVGKARRTANQLRYQLERELALADIEDKKKEREKHKPADPDSAKPAATPTESAEPEPEPEPEPEESTRADQDRPARHEESSDEGASSRDENEKG